MILRGKALQDEEDGDDLYVTLKDEGEDSAERLSTVFREWVFDYALGFLSCVDSLIVAVIPKRPAGVETYDDDDDDDDELVNYDLMFNFWKNGFFSFCSSFGCYGSAEVSAPAVNKPLEEEALLLSA